MTHGYVRHSQQIACNYKLPQCYYILPLLNINAGLGSAYAICITSNIASLCIAKIF